MEQEDYMLPTGSAAEKHPNQTLYLWCLDERREIITRSVLATEHKKTKHMEIA
jgi:hypothetical protein